MTTDVPAPEAPAKPKTSAEKRRDAAELKKLVAAIQPEPDPDLVTLTTVGETVAALLGRPVQWGTVGLVGHTHVAVPVADLVELVRMVGPHRGTDLLQANGTAVLRAMGYTGRDGDNPFPSIARTTVEIETPEESTP